MESLILRLPARVAVVMTLGTSSPTLSFWPLANCLPILNLTAPGKDGIIAGGHGSETPSMCTNMGMGGVLLCRTSEWSGYARWN
jgi:hypothetical protein